MDINDKSNIKFCYEKGEDLFEIEDKELITILLLLFIEAARYELEEK